MEAGQQLGVRDSAFTDHLLELRDRGPVVLGAAADGVIATSESAEIVCIAEELGFTRLEANALRAQYRDKLAEFQIGK